MKELDWESLFELESYLDSLKELRRDHAHLSEDEKKELNKLKFEDIMSLVKDKDLGLATDELNCYYYVLELCFRISELTRLPLFVK